MDTWSHVEIGLRENTSRDLRQRHLEQIVPYTFSDLLRLIPDIPFHNEKFLPLLIILAVLGIALGAGGYLTRPKVTTPAPPITPQASGNVPATSVSPPPRLNVAQPGSEPPPPLGRQTRQ